MIYIDPPYGISFRSNFQPQLGERDVKDREQDLTREPEMVRAYRETLENDGLIFSGVSPDEKFIEIVELSKDEHPWFLACQFHPEFKSKPLAPHPLFASFVHAAFQNRLQTETSVEQITEADVPALERATMSSEN
jgi:hypothetical protein